MVSVYWHCTTTWSRGINSQLSQLYQTDHSSNDDSDSPKIINVWTDYQLYPTSVCHGTFFSQQYDFYNSQTHTHTLVHHTWKHYIFVMVLNCVYKKIKEAGNQMRGPVHRPIRQMKKKRIGI